MTWFDKADPTGHHPKSAYACVHTRSDTQPRPFAAPDRPPKLCDVKGLVRLLRGFQSGGMPGFVNCPGTDPLWGGFAATLQQSCLV